MKRIVVAALLAIGLIGTAHAQPVTADAEKYPNLANPILLAQPADLPDVAECRGILSQVVLDLVNGSDDDPGEGYEKHRKQHPHMIMEPPPLECASKLWKALKKGGRLNSTATVPEGTEGLSLRQYPVDSLFDLRASAASLGTNVNPAGGVEGYQGETAISVDPNNPQHMIAFSNTFFKDPTPACQSPTGGTANTFGTMSLFGSTDGGANWTYNCAPWPAGATGGVPSAAFWFGSDPALAWDNLGRAYACYMLISQSAAGASGASIVVARSADNGTSWQNLGIVVNNITSATAGDDKEMMAIDNTTGQPFSHPGRIYVIWDAANNEKIAYSDNGTAWTTVNFASNTGAIGGNVVVGADGTVYVIWNRFNVETIVFSKSTDGGATWTAPAVISTMALQSFGTNNTPPAQNSRGINAFGSIDIDRNPASPFFGTLYVAFPDFPVGTTAGSDINTYVIRSTNGGTSWSSRVKVNDDNFGATQFFPWLSVDQSDGTVNVSWYDTRLDPLNRKTQMVYARSSNGGVSFEPNLLVTDGGSAWRNNVNYSDENSTDNATFNANQYGDYSGISALNRQVHPLWADSRSFFPLADTVAPTRREDNATSTITNCSAPTALTAPAVNSTTAPSVVVSWSAPASWGTNATGGTYSVYRNTTNVFPGGSPLVSGLTATSYIDGSGVQGTPYFYFVRATNNCPGTILTPMTKDSAASPSVVYGTAGTAVGVLQGTVTSAGNGVSGATVTAGTFSATTNASGFYQFAAIDAGTYTVAASATGYTSASVPGVLVTAGATTVRNLSLTPLTPNACFTDTTYADFGAATSGSNVDIASTPGSVRLTSLGAETVDQVSTPASLFISNNLSATTWTGQTFRAGITGNLTKITAGLGLTSGTSGTCTVEIRNLNGAQPGTTVLATATLGPVTNVGNVALYTTTFATPAAVVSGTTYSIVLRNSVGNTIFGVRGNASSLANGQLFTTTNSGTLWTAVTADLYFTSYVTPPVTYPASGNISAIKDSGSVTGTSATWTTLSWTATTPANTSVQFQAAGSNNAAGPFTFVGPDGTAGTFFTTSGASLAQFNGKRYLQYKAILANTDNTVTPTLSDVTICETTVDCAASVPTVTPTPSPVCASSTGNTATGPAGVSSYAWGITNGTITSASNTQSVTYTAGASGSVGLSLTITNASGCQAVGTATVPINPIPATPTITPGGPTTFCPGGSVTLTSSSASGNQWYLNGNPIGGETNQQYIASGAGNYTVTVTSGGCTSAPSTATAVSISAVPATPTIAISNLQTLTVGGASGTFTLTFKGQTTAALAFNATAAVIQAQLAGLSTIGAGNVSVTGSGGAFTVTFSGPLTGPQPQLVASVAGGATATVNAAAVCASSAGNQASGPAGATTYAWSIGNGTITSATNIQTITYTAGASGTVTLNLSVTNAATCAASSAPATVPTNPIPATPTVTPGGPTTFCAGGSVTLTSSSGSGNQWYLAGSPIGGATNATYNATASGSYTVVVTASGCPSAPSAATVVTVNPAPATPTITPGGPTTFCTGGSVTLTSSSATGNQWFLNGTPIGGETNQQYVAGGNGSYTVVVTASGCPSAPSAATVVTVNPIPATPTITPGGPTTFCAGGSVTLTSSSASGNQWFLNGNPIGGETNATLNATASGNYTVVVTASGCPSAPSAATVVTVNPAPATPTITPGGPTTFCAGGSVTLTSSSATGNQWFLNGNPIAGETNQQYVAGGNGSYTVVVTASGCPSAPSAATVVTVSPIPATPTITPGGPTTFCAGGSVTLTSSSASGNQWFLNGNPIGGATNATHNASGSGSYTVVVTASGCPSAQSSATVVTVNPAPATPTITPGGPTTFCAGGNVTLTSSSASGNQWFLNGTPIGGETNQQYVATGSGSYTVVVTASGCPSAPSAATVVTVNPIPATPTITPGGPTTFCAGGSVTLTSSSASGNQWYLNGNPIGGQTNQQYVASGSGSYTVIVTASGCSSASSSATNVTVNPVPATPTITPGGPTTFCAGGNVTLTSSSASGNQWFLNGTPIGGETNQQYVASGSGSYTVVVTASGCPSSPSAATIVTVTPTPATPTITPGGPTTFCAGSNVTLTSSSASGNQWYLNGNPIAGETNQQYVASGSGSYTVVVTASGCPSAPSSATSVTVNPAPATPTITPGGPTTFCYNGGSVTLSSSSASGNQWFLEGAPIAGETGQTLVVTGPMIFAHGNFFAHFTVVVTASGCPSAASAAVTVTALASPQPTISAGGPTTFCTGGSVQLQASNTIGGQWYLDGSPIAGETGDVYTATASGTYTYIDTFYTACPSNPSNAIVVTVTAPPATPTITPGGPTTFCAGGSVTLTSSSASGNQWFLNGNPIGGETNQQYVATSSGSYTVVVTVSGCSSAASAATIVTVNPIPATPTITPGGPTSFCTGGSVTLTSSSATGNQWFLNGNPIGGETNQQYVATVNGSYTVVVTASGCSSAASAATVVTVNPIPATPTITPGGPTTFCAGGSVTLTSSSASGNQWFLNGNPLGGETNQQYVATTNGSYTVVVTTSGCSSAASSATNVTVNPAPATPTITPGGPTTFCTGGSVTLTSSSATGNQWFLNGNPIGGETNQQYVATANGSYTVVVTSAGCSSAASSATVVTVNPIPATPTITPGGPTTFCAGGSVTLTSSSASGNQWFLNGNPIGGETNQQYVATANGSYTVVVTASGCPSAASSATNVTVNPAPATPTITPGGPTTFCAGGSVTLTSSSATGNQWFLNGNPIGGETNQQYVATANGSYAVVVTASGCSSAASSATVVTVNPIPATPTITPGGPTTFCAGGSVTLTSSSASGNQWFLNGNPIGGETNQQYVATANGSYTVVVTASGCPSAASTATIVTVNPAPATPTITPGGPTTFCTGGNVTLNSSSASGNQWFLNGSPLGGATSQQYVATVAGDYTVTVTASGCSSASSAAQTVTINAIPNATITAPASAATGSTGNAASVANAGAGATYAWSATGGTITGGNGTPNVTFTAGAVGTLNLQVTVTAGGCSDTKSANVNVTAAAATVTVTSVTPPAGKSTGGRDVTIHGTGFQSGASVTFGGSAATNVVVVNATTITARTPAHAAGAVNVTVTNTDASTGTRTNGYTYVTMQFDANGDGVVDPADIFYLVNYLFLSGPPPAGPSGMLSGDANGDGLVDPADIFYVVNYLFMSGPAPNAVTPSVSSQSTAAPMSGAVTLGKPFLRGNRYIVPVSVTAAEGAEMPRALSLRVTFGGGAVRNAAIHRAGATSNVQPAFEISRAGTDSLAYLLVLDARSGGLALPGGDRSAVVAELELDARSGERVSIDVDPALTLLGDATGTHAATAAGRTLRVAGTSIDPRVQPQMKNRE
jgi:hypothetical protein